MEIQDITNWLSKCKLMHSIDSQNEDITTIIIKLWKITEFKTYKLTIYHAEREIELLDISSTDTSFSRQFLIRTRFSFYKDVLKRLESEISGRL